MKTIEEYQEYLNTTNIKDPIELIDDLKLSKKEVYDCLIETIRKAIFRGVDINRTSLIQLLRYLPSLEISCYMGINIDGISALIDEDGSTWYIKFHENGELGYYSKSQTSENYIEGRAYFGTDYRDFDEINNLIRLMDRG